MQVFYATEFVLPLPAGHRFPMAKYALLRAALAQWDGVRLQQAPAAHDEELALVHTRPYIEAVTQGGLSAAQQREIGFPWSAAMVERARRSVGATIAAARAALGGEGVAANIAGGTHHAYADRGGGFCVFNDVAVAARVLQAATPARHPPLQLAVIDLDVHQGNGTAAIFRDDPSVFTLSLHGAQNYPFRKEHSDLDVALPDGCGDADYLAALASALDELERRCAPALIFYLAGADVHEGDRLGRLKLSEAGVAARDRCVFEWAWQRRVPLVMVMAGGYGHDIDTTVRVQLNSYRVALAYWRRWQAVAQSMADECTTPRSP
jgi:acetoin utilization deacetylase AcuC-like enzyme